MLHLSAPLLGYLVCLLVDNGERLNGAMVRVALHRMTEPDPHSCTVPLILGGLFFFSCPRLCRLYWGSSLSMVGTLSRLHLGVNHTWETLWHMF